MTSQSINSIHKLLHRLTKESTHYYVEEKHIVSRSTLNGHTFYSRFKRFEGPITQTLIEQHLNKTLTLAIALKSDDLVFEYSGEHMIVFASLLQHLAQEFGINNLTITEHSMDKLVIYIPTNEYNSNTIDAFLEKSQIVLDLKLPQQWQILPKKNRPEIGNLLLLPREVLEIEDF